MKRLEQPKKFSLLGGRKKGEAKVGQKEKSAKGKKEGSVCYNFP